MGSRPGDAAHLVALRSASEALDGGDDEVHAVLPHLLWHVAVLPSTTCGISSVWAPASVKPWSRVGARTLISGYCICFRSISSEEGSASVMVAGLSGGRVGVRTIGWSRGRQRRALGWVRLGRVAAHASSATQRQREPVTLSPNPSLSRWELASSRTSTMPPFISVDGYRLCCDFTEDCGKEDILFTTFSIQPCQPCQPCQRLPSFVKAFPTFATFPPLLKRSSGPKGAATFSTFSTFSNLCNLPTFATF